MPLKRHSTLLAIFVRFKEEEIGQAEYLLCARSGRKTWQTAYYSL